MVQIRFSKNDIDRHTEQTETLKRLTAAYEKVYVIVPEQLSLQREFSLGALFSGKVGVLGFRRLADEIFRTFGGGAKKLPDDVMIAAAVYKAVLRTKDRLTYYKSVAENSGFVTKLISAFSEFDINRMTYQSVLSLPQEELSPSVKSKYSDLFTIYDEYKRLWQDEYKAPGDDIINAAGVLELNPFFENTAVIFDGFYGFTPSQLVMIAQILSQAKESIFYFTTDMESEVFLPVDREIDKITRLCKKSDLPVSYHRLDGKSRFASQAVSFVEKYCFCDAEQNAAFENDGTLTVYSAKNLSDELGFIACKIKNDVLSGKYRYSDIAVLAPNPEDIATVASEVFKKHGVPVFADVKHTLLSRPLMAFVLHAIETVTEGFEYESVFAFLKTGLTGIEFDDISSLENYVRMWKIRNKGWHSGAWTQSPYGLSGKKPEDGDERLEKLNELRERIYRPLSDFAQRLKKAQTCKSLLCAVYDLLEGFNVRDNLENIAGTFLSSGNPQLCDEYIRIYDIFMDMLDSINKVFAEDRLSLKAFCDMLSVCAANVSVSGRPSRIDEVVLAGIGLVREENVKCVYIPCMNGDVLPKPFSDSSLISESDKRLFMRHGVPVSMDFTAKALRERFDLYVAMTAPENELVLSMSGFTVTGEPKTCSDYLEDILGRTGIRMLEREDLPDEFFMVSVSAACEIAANGKNPDISEAVYELTGFSPVRDKDDSACLADSIVRGMYSNHLRLSFSGVEEYVGCPFKFFLHRGLRIGKNEAVEFNPANMGTFIHAGLERLLGGDYDILSADEKKLKQIVAEISDDYYQNDLKDCKNRSRRFDYLFGRAKYALESAAVNVASELWNSDFTPYDFEIDISKYVDPVSIGDGYSLSLVGSIDRVDMFDSQDGKYVKIIDYKSGSQKFSLKKIYNGLSMQLPIYAGAVRAKHGDVKLAAMYYLKVGVPVIEHKGSVGMDDETYSKKLSAYYTRDGLFCGDGSIMPGLDKSGEFLSKVKKTSIVKSENMDKLVDFTMSKVQEIGTQIVSGNIAATPVCDSDVNACSFCDYKAICGIEQTPERARTLSPLPEDFLSKEACN